MDLRELACHAKEQIPWLFSPLMTGAALNEYLEYMGRNRDADDLHRLASHLEPFSHQLGEMLLGRLGAEQIRNAFPTLNSGSPSSTELTAILQLLNWAESRRLISPEITKRLGQLRPDKKPALPWSIISSEQAQGGLFALAKGSDCIHAAYAAAGLFLAALPHDLVTLMGAELTWEDERAFLFFRNGKLRRRIPVAPNLMRWIGPFCTRSGVVFPPGTHRATMRKLQRAGFHWTWDEMQHAYAAHRVALAGNPFQVAKESGRTLNWALGHTDFSLTCAEAESYFSVTPEACGIQDWAAQVEARLRDATVGSETHAQTANGAV